MSTDYNYDEQGQFFPFFILTIAGLITFPLTYNLLKPSQELESTAPRIKASFKPAHDGIIQGQKKKQRRRERKIKRFITVVVGYLMMAWMVYLIAVTQRTTPKLWNPYDILDISRTASEKEIKSHFRKLTLKYHPDKMRPEEGSNKTEEDITAHYVELNKAYKALTDEEIRNNYLQYGHPDGKQSFSIGIALPTFLVADGYGKYTLAMYGALLGVLLPYIVGKWWYGSQRVTKEGVLVSSAGQLFQQWREDLARGGVITAVSHGDEYNHILKGNKADAGLGKVEKAILAEDASAAKLNAKDRLALQKMDGPKRKALALLWAYLGRIELDDPMLNDEKYEVAPQALVLNESFIATCLAFGNLIPLLHAYGGSQNIIAAVPPGASPLLQLPYVTPDIAAKLEGDARAHLSLQSFMELPEAERRKRALHQTGGLTQAQYDEAMAVARQIPYLRLEKAFFKCMGEKHIVTGALTQLVLKCRFIPPGTSNVPVVTELDLEDLDPDEDDIDGMLGRKPPKKLRGKDGKPKNGTQPEKESAPPLAYAPFFARDHAPRWHLFLSDMRQGRVAVPPTTFTTFPLPIFNADGTPTFNMQTLKLQFQAPPQAGKYTFVMHLLCDSYLGMDVKQEVTLEVEDQQKAGEIEEEEEISEPEEDSLAGQMSALKSGGLPSPRKKKAVAKQESDDESDTEGEEDDTSETDTDTSSDEE